MTRLNRAPGKALISAAIALGLSAVADAASADPQTPSAPSTGAAEPYGVHVCNNSGKKVVVAATYQAVGDDKAWTHQGWWSLGPGECKYIFNARNPSFALRAESLDDPTYWGTADFQQCFQTAGPYQFTTPLDVTTCPAPSNSRPAVKFDATARGAFTWSIPVSGWQPWTPPSS